MSSTSDKTEMLTVRVSPSLKYDLREKAEKEGMHFSEALRYALRKWVEHD